MAINYQQVVADSIAELSALMQKKRRLNSESAKLQRQTEKTRKILRWAAEHLAQDSDTREGLPCFSTDKAGEIGFTEAVRSVLKTYPIGLTPVMVRDLLETVGFDMSRYQSPLPSIHVILRRLLAHQEVVTATTNGQHSYVWSEAISAQSPQDRPQLPKV